MACLAAGRAGDLLLRGEHLASGLQRRLGTRQSRPGFLLPGGEPHAMLSLLQQQLLKTSDAGVTFSQRRIVFSDRFFERFRRGVRDDLLCRLKGHAATEGAVGHICPAFAVTGRGARKLEKLKFLFVSVAYSLLEWKSE
ncbi:hypothetical protein AB0I99_10580 [Streptomyces spongiicola]|uniref:hypothetical protein n=1 Tax=Streptomyces spongiicola TaxID=1690221 RepID=UPI0034027B0D